jgi:transcriptional regulator with XRE-family HTH domain
MGINAKEIGKRIKAVRKANGLTQEAFAGMIGTSLTHVGKIEAGMRMASIDLLVEMAVKCNVTLDYLILGR